MSDKTRIGKNPRQRKKMSASKAIYPILAMAGMLFFYGSGVLKPALASEPAVNCNAHEGVCSLPLGDLEVTLEISPRPVKAMQDLVFKVSITNHVSANPPYIDLGMPGMKMGPNRVLLESTGQDTYEGKGVIVRCPSGRRTWFADVIVPGSGAVKFVFDVIY
jgi:hypothetical protein